MKHLFSVFDVTRQVFYQTPLSLGIVNLKPLLPGHVLIIPRRVVPRLNDLHAPEVADLFNTVQHVGRALEKAYGAEALTVSLQDGALAGQSVPHVHVHILPRKSEDFKDNDDIYPALEESEAQLGKNLRSTDWKIPSDDERQPRSFEEMKSEARWLSTYCVNDT